MTYRRLVLERARPAHEHYRVTKQNHNVSCILYRPQRLRNQTDDEGAPKQAGSFRSYPCQPIRVRRGRGGHSGRVCSISASPRLPCSGTGRGRGGGRREGPVRASCPPQPLPRPPSVAGQTHRKSGTAPTCHRALFAAAVRRR